MNDEEFKRVLHAVIQLFAKDRQLLELRGSLIIRNMCTLLNATSIYRAFASILCGDLRGSTTDLDSLTPDDLEFRSIMVQTLNLILLTARELDELRRLLTLSLAIDASQEATDLFTIIFSCWCHNPVATLSLCLLAQAYDLASSLIMEFAGVDVTVGFLMQVDKLVQLLESPVFIQLRLQLLEVASSHHPQLVKSLYGLLMLLPQSTAFRTLSARLATVATLQRHVCACHAHTTYMTDKRPEQNVGLLKCFRQVQSAHKGAHEMNIARFSLTP